MQYFHDQIVHFYIQWEGEHFYCDAYILRQTTCPSAQLFLSTQMAWFRTQRQVCVLKVNTQHLT